MKKLIFVSLLLITGLSMYAQAAPSIVFSNLTHDFGNITEEAGNASCEFVFTNNGNAPLVINNVTAMCGCTKPDWTKEPIAPGKTGFIKATYGAKGRPGSFSKTITVFSNAKDGNVLLNIKGVVTPKTVSMEDQYPFSISDLRLKSVLLSMYDVSTNGLKTDRIEVYNSGKAPLLVRFGRTPSHLTLVANPATLNAGAKGEITVTYNGKTAKDWGPRNDDVYVLLNNETRIASDRKLVVSANLVEDFSTLTPAQREAAGRAELSALAVDFGVVKSGEAKEQTLVLKNTGKSTLQIRKINTEAITLKTKIDRMSIPAGKTASIKIAIVPSKIRGGLNERVNIICNDPLHSKLVVRVTSSI